MSLDRAGKPLAFDDYETLAEPFAARVDTKPHNAYYERPATLSLLPDVRGKRVLDAGCGPGVYVEWLANHGAEVLGFDVSAKMVHLAKQRVGTRAHIRRAHLGRPLDFLANASFDIVLSTLVLDYVNDWDQVFREFHRVLRQPGYLIFSVGHPFAEFTTHPSGNYFHTELVEFEFRGFGTPVRVPSYRRPLSALVNPLIEAGFTLERIIEPTPTEEFKHRDPKDYEELSRQPGFLCVRAVTRVC
jgi:SAM-dependent methyltransferase